MTTWLPRWRRNNFRTADGKPVSNQGLICYIDSLLDERRQAGQKVRKPLRPWRSHAHILAQVKFEHVYGHRGDVGNEGADHQANLGCVLPTEADRDWQALETKVRARIEEAKAAMDLADEEGMLEAMSDDKPLASSTANYEPPKGTSPDQSAPRAHVAEEDLMVREFVLH